MSFFDLTVYYVILLAAPSCQQTAQCTFTVLHYKVLDYFDAPRAGALADFSLESNLSARKS